MFALESTLSGRTYVKLFEEAKQRGYKIELHFVWIPDVREAIAALLMGPDGGFVTGSDFLMDGGVTAAYWFGELAPELALSSSK